MSVTPAVLPGLESIVESLGIGGDDHEHDNGHDTAESGMDSHDHRRRRRGRSTIKKIGCLGSGCVTAQAGATQER